MGVYFKSMTNDIGVDVGLPLDFSIGYEFPYYSDNQYHVLDLRPNLLLGGKSYVTISLYFMRVTLFFDLVGAKYSLSARSFYDVINRDAFCYAVDWRFEALRLKVNA